MSTQQFKIVKMEESTPPASAGMRKTVKTYPKGILKTTKSKFNLKPTSDPAKSPPVKKSMKKHTIRLITDKGLRHHRKTIKQRVSKMSDDKVKKLVSESGLLKNATTPVGVMRAMLEGGIAAGFIST
jgi:hypothetical protein